VRGVARALGHTGAAARVIPALAPSTSSARTVLLLMMLLWLLRMCHPHAKVVRPVGRRAR
jgi:hypothetical protein